MVNAKFVGKLLLEHFERVYVLNLPERADRRKEIEAHLDRFGMPADGSAVKMIQAIRPTGRAGFPTVGSRGCFLSHLNVIREARDDDLANVLILEDDLQFTPLITSKIDEVIATLRKADWNLCYLGHCLHIDAEEKWAIKEYNEPIIGSHFQAIHGDTLRPMCGFLEEVLTRPPGNPEGGPMYYDGAQNMFRSLHPGTITLISVPTLGVQRSSRSDVSPKWFDRLPLIRTASTWSRQRLRRESSSE